RRLRIVVGRIAKALIEAVSHPRTRTHKAERFSIFGASVRSRTRSILGEATTVTLARGPRDVPSFGAHPRRGPLGRAFFDRLRSRSLAHPDSLAYPIGSRIRPRISPGEADSGAAPTLLPPTRYAPDR